MEIDRIQWNKPIKVEKTRRVKRANHERDEEQEPRRNFADMLEDQLDEVEIDESPKSEKSIDRHSSIDTVTLSTDQPPAETPLPKPDSVELSGEPSPEEEAGDEDTEDTKPDPERDSEEPDKPVINKLA